MKTGKKKLKILITGSTGYIGRRLKVKLLEQGDVHLRLYVRNTKKVRKATRKKVEIVKGDIANRKALLRALSGIDMAYYLIHSMGSREDFEVLDRKNAEIFRDSCIDAGVKRIIYLGGLGIKETASKHLRSRIETGEILSGRPDKIQTIFFRAGVIIGSGGASFEIIRHLVHKMPVIITPRRILTRTQPIGIGDVIKYLIKAKDLKVKKNIIVDIGTEQMTYKEMLEKTAEVIGLNRKVRPIPYFTPRFYSYLLVLLTPIPFRIASALLEGLKSETIILNDNAKKFFPGIRPRLFVETVKEAIEEIEKDQVISRWCDSSAKEVCDIHGKDDISRAVFVDRKFFDTNNTPARDLFASIQSIGGESGWFTYNFLWKFRGLIDKLLGGAGINRGRRASNRLRVGDSLDIWKVVDIIPDRRLLLTATMKLHGRAWLEFVIDKKKLVLSAYFRPIGLWGRIYWYLLLPFHNLIFRDLAKKIIIRAKKDREKKMVKIFTTGGSCASGRKH